MSLSIRWYQTALATIPLFLFLTISIWGESTSTAQGDSSFLRLDPLEAEVRSTAENGESPQDTVRPNVQSKESVTEDEAAYPSGTIGVIRDVTQIIFYIVVTIVGVLTYIGAKRTLLQPFRTEIFKRQIDELSIVLALFHGKSEIDLRDSMAFERLFFANCWYAIDQYALAFFDLTAPVEERLYSKAHCPEIIWKISDAQHELRSLNEHTVDESTPATNTRGQLRSSWKERQHGGALYLPAEYCDYLKQLERVRISPLIPKKCRDLIGYYLEVVRENATILSAVLHRNAAKFEELYPDKLVLNKVSFTAIRKEYINSFKNLKPYADEIVKFVETYFAPNDIFKTK